MKPWIRRNDVWKKILTFISNNRVIILILILAGIFFYFQSRNNAIERRLLERNFTVLRSDVTAVKEEQRELRKNNAELIVHATKLDEWINKYGAEIDELGKFNTESRQQLAIIRADIRATKTELSTDITGLKKDIESVGAIQSINTENGTIYDEMDRRLKELAERYNIDLK